MLWLINLKVCCENGTLLLGINYNQILYYVKPDNVLFNQNLPQKLLPLMNKQIIYMKQFCTVPYFLSCFLRYFV